MSLPNLKTTFESNTIRALLVGIITLLTVFGFKIVIKDADIDKIVEGVGAAILLGSMVAGIFFRKNADSKIVPTEVKEEAQQTMLHQHPVGVLSNDIPGQAMKGAIIAIDDRDGQHKIYGPILLFCLVALTVGTSACVSRPEMAAQREAMHQATAPILEDWQELYTPVATNPQGVPNLFDNETPADRANWLEQREQLKKDYYDTLAKLRANDAR
jgi:hypothetical protein